MDYTEKVIRQSNVWYNDGLKKAQMRDMSGAILSLRQSLQYNGENIAARNLLGLVYYGQGEVAEALVEWIISKNLQPRENLANGFIRRIQNSAKELDKINQAVKKYNQCLIYCERRNEKLALADLKQVVAAHPSFLKAHQLLALLYMHTEEYKKAKKQLQRARKLDTTNEITLRYLHELSKFQGKQGKTPKKRRKKKEAIEYHVGNDTIIQPAQRMAKELAGKFTVMNIVLGIGIGAAVVWFLIVPAVEESRTDERNRQMIEYSERINAMEAQISAQTRALDGYRSDSADSEAAVQNAAGTADSYENLMLASEQYSSGNYSEDLIADTLLNVNRESLGEGGKARYDELTSSVFPEACSMLYESGNASYEVANYETAINNLSRVVRMDESYDNGGALLHLGLAYMYSGDAQSATAYLKRINELLPDSDNAAEAKTNLAAIAEAAAGSAEE